MGLTEGGYQPGAGQIRGVIDLAGIFEQRLLATHPRLRQEGGRVSALGDQIEGEGQGVI